MMNLKAIENNALPGNAHDEITEYQYFSITTAFKPW
jgi:hypothetical protein